MMLEARHAWRSVCDHLAHEFRPAVERLARQHRSELAQHEVRLGMADAAALLVKPPSEPFLVGQLTRIAALREYRWRGNAAKQENGGGARHPWHSPKFIFLAKHRPALAETEGRGRTLCSRANRCAATADGMGWGRRISQIGHPCRSALAPSPLC